MASESELSKLQAVKELIFGQEIEDYSAEFKKIHQLITDNAIKIDSNNTNLEKTIADLEKSINNRIDKLEAEMLKKINLLDNKKTDRAKLGKMLIQIGEKLQDNS